MVHDNGLHKRGLSEFKCSPWTIFVYTGVRVGGNTCVEGGCISRLDDRVCARRGEECAATLPDRTGR